MAGMKPLISRLNVIVEDFSDASDRKGGESASGIDEFTMAKRQITSMLRDIRKVRVGVRP